MKLKEYIQSELRNSKEKVVNFNIGVNTDIEVDDDSKNRVKFSVVKRR